jgi:hypothetical protein
MDLKSKIRTDKMTEEYPKIKLIIIDKNLYKDSLEYENSFPEATKVDVKDMFLDE